MVMTTPPPGSALPPAEETRRDPVRASQYIFRVLLDALANPGTIRPLIVHPLIAADASSVQPYIASLLVTMLDHEVSLHIAQADDADALRDLVVRRTRVAMALASDADFVVAAADMDSSLPEQLKRGSLEFPDDGATLVVRVPSLTDPDVTGLNLALRGPGIPETRSLRVSGIGAGTIESRNHAVANYPTGIDLLLTDDAGMVAGIPRTTVITITQEGGR